MGLQSTVFCTVISGSADMRGEWSQSCMGDHTAEAEMERSSHGVARCEEKQPSKFLLLISPGGLRLNLLVSLHLFHSIYKSLAPCNSIWL